MVTIHTYKHKHMHTCAYSNSRSLLVFHMIYYDLKEKMGEIFASHSGVASYKI